MKKKLFLLTLSAFLLTPFASVSAKSAAQYITDLSATDTVNMATDDPDHNPRYIGANPNNYVLFNNELWRIIGVFDGKVKIMRVEALEDGYERFVWDTSPSNVNSGSGVNYWPQADLMYELNGDYLNSDLSEDTLWYSNTYNSKSSVFNHNKVIKADAKEMIADAVWYLGAINYDGETLYNKNNLNADLVYANERKGTPGVYNPGTSNSNDGILDRDPTWTGKVAFHYPSDFLYSTSGGETSSRSTCQGMLSWYYDNDCSNNSWMVNMANNDWTITPLASDGKNIYIEVTSRNVGDSYFAWGSGCKTRPSLHLKENVLFSDGDGSSSNPYKLALANVCTFNSNGGSDVETQYIGANEKVTNPTDPTKDDSTFLGWFTDQGLTNKYDFNSEVNGNLTLYAKWQFNYKILEGDNQTFDGKDLVIKTNGDINKITAIKDNGEVIGTDNYTLQSGSTILTLNANYISSLSSGIHTITFVYSDGEVSASLNVPGEGGNSETETTNPKTKDNLIIYISLLSISALGFGISKIYKKKLKKD